MNGERIARTYGLEDITELLDWYQAALLDDLEAEGITPVRVADYLSPYLPLGYDSILGYLAKREPLILSMIDEDEEATMLDEQAMVRKCEAAGVKVVPVAAPLFLTRQGVFEVSTYPVQMLVEHFKS